MLLKIAERQSSLFSKLQQIPEFRLRVYAHAQCHLCANCLSTCNRTALEKLTAAADMLSQQITLILRTPTNITSFIRGQFVSVSRRPAWRWSSTNCAPSQSGLRTPVVHDPPVSGPARGVKAHVRYVYMLGIGNLQTPCGGLCGDNTFQWKTNDSEPRFELSLILVEFRSVIRNKICIYFAIHMITCCNVVFEVQSMVLAMLLSYNARMVFHKYAFPKCLYF